MKKKKIIVVGLFNAKNLGDPLLCECTEYLIRKIIGKEHCVIQRAEIILKDEIISQRMVFLMRKEYRRYYEGKFKEADYIIFAGGGLIKFKQQKKINLAVFSAIEIAQKYRIPVAFQSVGVEGYNDQDKGCLRLEQAINAPIVHGITVRDDLNTLENKYKKRDFFSAYAADSAVWCAEMLNIKKQNHETVIGLGVARPEIFKDYGIEFSEGELTLLYINMIKCLLRRGIKWKLFCNGYAKDYQYAINILRCAQLAPEQLLPCPNTPRELVEQIADFSAIAALRLHACITAYSLNIPFAGLCWNQKVKQFGEAIGYPEYIYEVEDFDAEIIISNLLKNIDNPYNQKEREAYRNTSFRLLEEVKRELLPIESR